MPFLAAAPIAGAAGAAGLSAGAAGLTGAVAGGSALASALVPAAVGAIGGMGTALMQQSAQNKQMDAMKEASMPVRMKVPLTPEQQKMADNMSSGLGLDNLRQNVGLGFGQQQAGGSRVQNLGNRLNSLRSQVSAPTQGGSGMVKPMIGQ